MEKVTVLMIDDHRLFLDAWTDILQQDERFTVIGKTSNVNEAFELMSSYRPHIIWTEIHLLSMDGIAITEEAFRRSPQSNIMVVSGYGHPGYVRKMMQAGAKGYVTKNSSREELIEGLLQVNKGNRFISHDLKQMLSEKLTGEAPPALLSRKELQIVHGIREGLSSKEIAVRLNVTPKTVQVHRYNILKKLQLKNVAALINYIHTHGV